ncbi:MAG: hypothetical protein R3D67_06890 [Hyphomicrobiaceae bacterium]
MLSHTSLHPSTAMMAAGPNKKQKADALMRLKQTFRKSPDTTNALDAARSAVLAFARNHNCDTDQLTSGVDALGLPADPVQQELLLRKAINTAYKDRANLSSKVLAIYLVETRRTSTGPMTRSNGRTSQGFRSFKQI